MGEVDVVDVEPGNKLVRKPEDVTVEGRIHSVADLLLVVEDFDIVVAVEQLGLGIPGVVLDITPVPLAGQVIQGVVDLDAVGDIPLGLELGPAVLIADRAVERVVVLEA